VARCLRLREGKLLRCRFTILAFALAVLCASPAAATPNFFVGFAEDDASGLAATRGHVSDLGLRGLRVPLWWRQDETLLDDAQTAEIARAVTAAPARVRVVVSVGGYEAPLDPAARERYCGFVRDLLRRFPTVKDVIIWNEPNKSAYWVPQFNTDGSSAAPVAYVALLARCWDILHAFRPAVNVIAPATSPRGNDNASAISNVSHSPFRFIREMGEAYRASGRHRRLFDTVAHHAYGSGPPERPWRTHSLTQISQGDWRKLTGVLEAAFGGTDQALPGECRPGGCVWIWYTEFGYQTEPDEMKRALYTGTESVAALPDFAGGEPESPPPPVTTSAPDQWTQILDGIRLAYCQPYVQGVFNYLLADNPDLDRWQSGFLWADRTPKDSYPAAKQVVAETAARAVDCSRLKGGPAAGVDVAAPRRPALLAIRRRSRRLVLRWQDGGERDVMSYQVSRSRRRSGPFRLIARKGVGSPSFVDRRVRNGRTYCYVVTAGDTSENKSPRSRPRCAAPRRPRPR
jgi:hypothetical protein